MGIKVARSEEFEQECKLLAAALSAMPYDLAIFGEYATATDGGLCWRARLVLRRDSSAYGWSPRWVAVPQESRAWLESGHTWVDDIREFALEGMIDSSKAPYLQGIRSFVSHPFNEAGSIKDVLTLGAHMPGIYSEAHLTFLKSSHINAVVETLRVSFRERWRQFISRLHGLFRKGLRPELAGRFARAIATEFDWPHVGCSVLRGNGNGSY
jgi:hypothetical protein